MLQDGDLRDLHLARYRCQVESSAEHYRQFIICFLTVFCDVAPCSTVESDLRFRGTYRLHHQGEDTY